MRIFKLSISAFFSISLVFWAGCTKDFSDVVEESSPVYSINYIKPLPDTALTKKDTLSLEVGFSSANKPASVQVEFVTSSQAEFSTTLTQTSSTSNFFGKAIVGSTVPGGQYEVNYFVNNDDGSTTSIGKQNIIIRKWDNSAPVIDSVYASDTITVSSSSVTAYLEVQVSDADGASDVAQVYYTTLKPNGDTNGPFYLADDGVLPDLYAGDRIYTAGMTITSSVTKGTYRFDFQAKDKSGAVSAIKSHYITIK